MARGQKATPRGEWSAERKETQNAWKREKRATISATVDKETAAAFRALCSARGLSVNAAVSLLIDTCIASGDLVQFPGDAVTTSADRESSETAATSGDRRGDDQTADQETGDDRRGDRGDQETGDRSGAEIDEETDAAGNLYQFYQSTAADGDVATHPAQCDGENLRHSDEHPEVPSSTRKLQENPGKSPRVRPDVGNSAPSAIPREYAPAAAPAPASAPAPVPAIKKSPGENPREEIPPEKSLGEIPHHAE